MEKFVEKFNPANAASISADDVAEISQINDEQLAELARVYPNKPTGNNYLVLRDTTEKDERKQTYPRSTYQNLFNLRKMGQKQWQIVGFAKTFKPVQPPPTAAQAVPSKTVDLSEEEAKSAEGMKEVPPPTAAQAETAVEPTALEVAKKKVEEAKANGAHPNLIKKLEKEVAELSK